MGIALLYITIYRYVYITYNILIYYYISIYLYKSFLQNPWGQHRKADDVEAIFKDIYSLELKKKKKKSLQTA